MKEYKFNKEWLNKLLEVKDNDSVWLSLSDNDTRILLTYIEVLQSKIDKAIEYIEQDILDKKIEKVNWDFDECYYSDMPAERIKPLIDILQNDEKNE